MKMNATYWIWIHFSLVTYGRHSLDMWFELELDIIVVMPRRDLLSFLTFGLSAIYAHFELKMWVSALYYLFRSLQ
jgi:hypothetical protein